MEKTGGMGIRLYRLVGDEYYCSLTIIGNFHDDYSKHRQQKQTQIQVGIC